MALKVAHLDHGSEARCSFKARKQCRSIGVDYCTRTTRPRPDRHIVLRCQPLETAICAVIVDDVKMIDALIPVMRQPFRVGLAFVPRHR